MTLALAGFPAPQVQYPILDELDMPLARVDLAYPEARLAIEYDGAGHYQPHRHRHDVERDALLAIAGWQTLRLGAPDLGSTMLQTLVRIMRLVRSRCPELYADLDFDRTAVYRK